MILLDTNVISELMRPEPDSAVLSWFAGQPSFDYTVSAISVFEIHYGIQRLTEGRRRADLADRFAQFLARGFTGRVLSFDQVSAEICGDLLARRQWIGRPMIEHLPDAMIAAIAQAGGFPFATRNVADFDELGLELINPWLPG